jgi:hypothetical protein
MEPIDGLVSESAEHPEPTDSEDDLLAETIGSLSRGFR